MSKIQSSIEKAIEKSRSADLGSSKDQPKRRSSDLIANASEVASNVYRMFRSMRPDEEIMKKSRIVSTLDNSSASAAYNVLRTRILQRMRSNNWHTLLVTSAGSGEGKSLTASNLAVSLSNDVNQSVLLVDLDLRRSTIAKYLGFEIDVQAGIGDFLTGNAQIPDIVYVPMEMERFAISSACCNNSSPSSGDAANRCSSAAVWLGASSPSKYSMHCSRQASGVIESFLGWFGAVIVGI